MQSSFAQNGDFTKSKGKIKLITELNMILNAVSLKLAIHSIRYVHQKTSVHGSNILAHK